mmetsp:Transcript_15916/g.23461  ORF Transcript_15916/g.23461 Transcript_15916/m.23461 type:complete len:214 (+) Transcript_15916:138-779(+)
MLQDSLSVDSFLSKETSGGKHRKTSMLQLLCLHFLQFQRIFGREAKRIPAKVAGSVVLAHETCLANRNLFRRDEGCLGTADLNGTNDNDQECPELMGDLKEMSNGRSLDGCIPQEGASFDLLTNEESNGSEHGDTTMGDLGLTVTLQGSIVGLGSKPKRIPETSRCDHTWEFLNHGSLVNSSRRLGCEGLEGSGRSHEGEDGGSDGLHVCLIV